MNASGTAPSPREDERYLSPAAVAGLFLTRVEDVRRWIEEGRLRAEPGGRYGYRIPESALAEFRALTYRRENFSGLDHGLRSWPTEQPQPGNLPILAQSAQEAEALAPRWPFPHA